MPKRTVNLLSVVGATAAPASKMVRIDGDFAELSLNAIDLQGTSPTVAVSLVQQINPRLSLPYDDGSGTFTVGRRIRGSTSGASGVIVVDDADNDTLQLVQASGRFQDNETIREVDLTGSATAASATVNSGTGGTTVYDDGVTVASLSATNADGQVVVDNASVADPRPPSKWNKLTVTAGGTWTSATFTVDLDVIY